MQMAKADEKDMEAMAILAGLLMDVDRGQYPRDVDGEAHEDDPEYFDEDDPEHLKAFYSRVMGIINSAPGAVNRVVLGFHTLMHNNVVDPDVDHLALNPRIVQALKELEWISATESKPDADTTVMTFAPNSNEPIWPGYLDMEGDKDIWLEPGGRQREVSHWKPFPGPPETTEQGPDAQIGDNGHE